MDERIEESVVGRHWVIIETGANQDYIFACNKQAVNVGASQLIWQVGHGWICDAISQVGDSIEPVVLASGKALLLVDSVETGRAVIRTITRRALAKAPGLLVWGVVDPEPIADPGDVGAALKRAHGLHANWRGRLPARQLRYPTLPFVEQCHYSGLPATDFGHEGEERRPRNAAIDWAWRARDDGRDRLGGIFGQAVVSRERIKKDGVTNVGWIAVMHADGNAIGQTFLNLHRAYQGGEFIRRLHDFSEAIDRVTREALTEAVTRRGGRDWLVPLVVGGDDVTVIMDGRLAFDVTVDFLEEFTTRAAGQPAITSVLEAVREKTNDPTTPERLTASAGIAYVKPHFAFSEAYQLAEQLCQSAKSVKTAGPGCSALDFQVLHDTFGRDLAGVRVPLTVAMPDTGTLSPWAGPIVVTTPEGGAGEWAAQHHVGRLREAMSGLQATSEDEPAVVSRSALHRLRQALLRGGGEIARAAEPAKTSAKARAFFSEHLCVPDPRRGSEEVTYFSRILAASDLIDMKATKDLAMAVEGA